MSNQNRDSTPAPTTGTDGGLGHGDSIGDYVVVRRIASGGFGSVYEAHAPRDGQHVAIKVLHPELRAAGDPFLRFLREARLSERVRHPNIAEVHDSGILPDGRAYLVMELLSGHDLGEHIKVNGPVALDRALELLEPVCSALAHAHAANIVHRDVKSSNVYLDHSRGAERVVLLDFGLAKLLERGSVDLTSSRAGLGTPATMAPEQICGEPVTAQTDVYGLGALAYYMLTGRLPFSGNTRTVVQYMHLHGERPMPSALVNVQPAVDRVVARAMAPAMADRYPSATSFLEAMRDAAAGARLGRGGQAADREGLAVMIDVRVRDADTQDAAALDAQEAVLDDADRRLTALGFSASIEASSFAVYAQPLPAGSRDGARRRGELLAAIAKLHQSLAGRSSALRVNVAVHRDAADVDGDRVVGGTLLQAERWAPQDEVAGVVGARAVFDGLGAQLAAVPGAQDMHRLVALDMTATPPTQGSMVATPTGEISRERLMHSEMMARLGRQTAGIVHDLRSLLGSVIGNLDLLSEALDQNRPLDGDDREALAHAVQATERSIELATSILSASAVKSYGDERCPVALREIVDSAVNLSMAETRRKARVDVRCESDTRVEGARGRLTQVFVNLLVNAAHAIPEGRPGQIAITSAIAAQGRVRIEVSDNGTGMPDAVKQQIFEPFYTTKAVGEGTGLGLALVREIVEEHDGTIAVDSKQGEGTTFTIELPTAR